MFLDLPKKKRETSTALTLTALAFQLKEYSRSLEILEAASSEVSESRGFFYQGAARFNIFHGQVSRYQYLDQVAGGAFREDRNLEQITTWLCKARKAIAPENPLASRIYCYLAYCRILRQEWPAAQALMAAVGVGDALTKGERLLWREGMGTLAYCQHHYSSAVEHFSQCIAVAPWENCYYIFRLQNRLKQPGVSYDQLLDDCFRSLKLFPSNLEPVGLIGSYLLQAQHDEYYCIKLLSEFFKKSVSAVEPNILNSECRQTAAAYLQEFSGVGHSVTRALIAKINKVQKASAVEAFAEILCQLPDKQYLLTCLHQALQRSSAPNVRKNITNILRQVEASYRTQKVQTWVARLMAAHDTTVIAQMAPSGYAEELVKILQQENLPVLLRYWAAEALLASRIPANYQLLQEQTRAKSLPTRSLALAVLARSGFEIEPGRLPAVLEKMPEPMAIIVGQHLAAYLPSHSYLPLAQSSNEKLRAMAGRALWLQGKSQGIAPLVSCFHSDQEEVRAYAYWWFWEIFCKKSPRLQQRAFEPQYLRQLQTALVADPSPLVRRVVAAIIGRLKPGSLHPKLQASVAALITAIREGLNREKDKTVRLQILMSLISHGELSLVVEHTLNIQETFDNRVAPWLKMFGDQAILSRVLTKNSYATLRFCLDKQIRRRLLFNSDPRFGMLYLMLLGMLGKDPRMPLFLKKTADHHSHRGSVTLTQPGYPCDGSTGGNFCR